jgi:hypothetical protein
VLPVRDHVSERGEEKTFPMAWVDYCVIGELKKPLDRIPEGGFISTGKIRSPNG